MVMARARDLSRQALEGVFHFLRQRDHQTNFVNELPEWSVVADALDENGLVHHAQQIRALAHYVSNIRVHNIGSGLERITPRTFKIIGLSNDIDVLASQAALALSGPGWEGTAPRSISGTVEEHGSELRLGSIIAKGFPSVPLTYVSSRALRGGAQQSTYRTTYAGHKYSGNSRDNGYFSLYRGTALKRRR